MLSPAAVVGSGIRSWQSARFARKRPAGPRPPLAVARSHLHPVLLSIHRPMRAVNAGGFEDSVYGGGGVMLVWKREGMLHLVT